MNIHKIISGCKSQDLRSQRLLYDKYCKRLYPVCIRYCKDEQSASSALQNGFLKIFKSISSLKDDDKIEAWMRRIMVHASMDQYKADKRFTYVEIKEEFMALEDPVIPNEEGNQKYLELLNRLPEGYRLVFSMRVLEEMSHKEIATILGITESTSRTQLLKARKMLKKIIDQKHVKI